MVQKILLIPIQRHFAYPYLKGCETAIASLNRNAFLAHLQNFMLAMLREDKR